MISLSLAPGSYLFYLFLVFLTTVVIFLAYNLIFFLRLAIHKPKSSSKKQEGISVVICARNAYYSLKENLPSLLEQDYPNFEVVIVNYASDDDTAYLLTTMADSEPRLKIVEIKENLNFFTGKKFPLSIGIKSAQNDLIVVTDPTCRPASRNWLSLLMAGFADSTEIVLGYGAYEKKKGFFNKLVRFDIAQNAVKYFSFALAGIPYKGVGRNLAYRRSLFFRNNGFISHYRLSSGEDDLFINKVARGSNTKIITNPESFTVAEAKFDFRNWFLWKKRKFFTPYFYRFKHKFLLGAYNFNVIAFYLLFICLLAFQYNPLFITAAFLFRMIFQILIFHFGMKRLKERGLAWFLPFFEIILLFINLSAFFSNLFIKTSKWR
jgi:glycosyltransferase involved in cell wall biosynthesis